MKRLVEGDLTKVKLTSESHGAQLEEIIEAAERELAHKINDLDDMKNLINTRLLVRVCRKQAIETTKLIVFFYDNLSLLNYNIGYIIRK
ncbi:hypothetical protein [Lysinibacillus sphaericus]|nr:hypothetical protein [Lysinibacillus sphaericus]PIJ96871.1 hypothetical protein CTN02_15785 [Lysinibacillus sphaericus]QTB25785.1 hypothetical protein J2D51_15910 [Lysinibacillus sphaericus]